VRSGRAILIGAFVLAGGCERVLGLSPIEAVDARSDAVDARSDAAGDASHASYVEAVLTDHPAAYFRLGETTGTTADDLVTPNSGTYLGEVVLGDPGALGGDPDTAVSFDGANGAVSLGDRFDFTGTQPFSIEAWIKPSFSGSYQTIASRWFQPSMRVGFTFWTYGDELGFERDISESLTSVIRKHVLVEGTWTHVVATYNGADLRIYLGGEEVGRAPSDLILPPVALPFLIGATNGVPSGSPFFGTLDEVAIYDHTLPADRIKAHFLAASPTPASP
jgi:hypothetical protein